MNTDVALFFFASSLNLYRRDTFIQQVLHLNRASVRVTNYCMTVLPRATVVLMSGVHVRQGGVVLTLLLSLENVNDDIPLITSPMLLLRNKCCFKTLTKEYMN